jgi:selenocysteine lyase/cysteine desulfurase
MSSKAIVAEAEKISNYGFRWGHFYSKRLCDELLKLEPEGVTRVSMVHYNTEDEIKGLVEVLKKVLPQV